MKKILSLIPLLALLTACNTTPPAPGQPSQTAVNIGIGLDATVPIAVATLAAKDPTTAHYFTAAALVIEGATSTGAYSPTALMAALDTILCTDSPGWQYAKLAIVSGVNLYAGLAGAGVITGTDATYCLTHFAADIRAGLPPASLESVKAKTAPARARYAKIIKKG